MLQMASTAAGVAVGSSIGHGISNMFGGGGSVEPAPAPESQSNANLNGQGLTCEMQSKGRFYSNPAIALQRKNEVLEKLNAIL